MKRSLLLAGLALGTTFQLFAQTDNSAPGTATPMPTGTVMASPSATAPAANMASVMNGPLKIGYTNVQYILAASPQTKVIKSQLESASKQYEKAIADKMKDLEDKFAAYQKNEGTMMESIKQDKQNELRTLETSIRSLQENASTELKAKESELVKPELDKIYAGINEVAKANGFTYILNSDQVILYASEGGDVSAMVLKKLGYPEPKDETEASSRTPATTSSTAAPAAKPAAGNRPTPPRPKKGK